MINVRVYIFVDIVKLNKYLLGTMILTKFTRIEI